MMKWLPPSVSQNIFHILYIFDTKEKASWVYFVPSDQQSPDQQPELSQV